MRKKATKKAATTGVPLGVFLEVAAQQKEGSAGPHGRSRRERARGNYESIYVQSGLQRRGRASRRACGTSDERETREAIPHTVRDGCDTRTEILTSAHHLHSRTTRVAVHAAVAEPHEATLKSDDHHTRASLSLGKATRGDQGLTSEHRMREEEKDRQDTVAAITGGSQRMNKSLYPPGTGQQRKSRVHQGRNCDAPSLRCIPTSDISSQFNTSSISQLPVLPRWRSGKTTTRGDYTSGDLTRADPEKSIRRELQQLKQQLAYPGKHRSGKRIFEGVERKEDGKTILLGDGAKDLQRPQPHTLKSSGEKSEQSLAFDPRRLRLRGHRLHAREKPSKLKAAIQLERKVRSELFAKQETFATLNSMDGPQLSSHEVAEEQACTEKKFHDSIGDKKTTSSGGHVILVGNEQVAVVESQHDEEGGSSLAGGPRSSQKQCESRLLCWDRGARPSGRGLAGVHGDGANEAVESLPGQISEGAGTAVVHSGPLRESPVAPVALPSSEKSGDQEIHGDRVSQVDRDSQADVPVHAEDDCEKQEESTREVPAEQGKSEDVREGGGVVESLTQEEASLRLEMLAREDVLRYELYKQLNRLKKKHHASVTSRWRGAAVGEDSANPAPCVPTIQDLSKKQQDHQCVLLDIAEEEQGRGTSVYRGTAGASQGEDHALQTEEHEETVESGNRRADAILGSSPKDEIGVFVGSYVDMVVGEDDWENALSDFLANVHRLQTRLLTKSPHKLATQRRYVLGFKAARQALIRPSYTRQQVEASEETILGREDSTDAGEENRRKPKLIVIAANCEPSVSKGGLSDVIADVLRKAREWNVPYVFSVSRNKLKRALGTSMRQSCVTLQNVEGVEAQLRSLLDLAGRKREAWLERGSSIRPL
ncbi:ribosomal protein l7ae [Cystoisospora suis]|uniref:Ribosomal protein l7ae n=1 Tax=Cystoisospora suis TaxID=483139 RepID=A0A2C6KYX7_9APIC|nr:ribosomal protein l7ae [Cystoisospora suis]